MMHHADIQSEDKAMLQQLVYRKVLLEKEYNQLPRKDSFSGLAILDELDKINGEIEELNP